MLREHPTRTPLADAGSVFSPSWHLGCLAVLVSRACQDVGSILRMLSGARLGRSEQYGLTGTALGSQKDARDLRDCRDQVVLPAAGCIAFHAGAITGMRVLPLALLFLLTSPLAFLSLQVPFRSAPLSACDFIAAHEGEQL